MGILINSWHTSSAKSDVLWWREHIFASSQFIHTPPVDLTIYSDASLAGWGATDSVRTIGDKWHDDNLPDHINVLELQAAKLALLSLAKDASACHIHLKIDNTTAVAYINKMGGTHSLACNTTARSIWLWAKERDIWLSAAFIPSDHNVVADFHSRCFKENTEWQLNPTIFGDICTVFPPPVVDLFASSLNTQLDTFVSWYPESGAWAVNAFNISWDNINFYAFPPFSIISRVLAKIVQEKATGILILPKWSSQAWFPLMLRLLTSHPRLIPPMPNLLLLPSKPNLHHPLHKKLELLAVRLSGLPSETTNYQKQLRTLSATPGGDPPEFNMIRSCGDGDSFVLAGKLIPLLFL